MAVLGIVSVVLVGLLGTRLWFLQVVDAPGLEERVSANRTRTVALLPERGRIFDSDGRILADNQRVLTITIDRGVLKRSSDREVLFERLSGPLGVPIAELEDRYASQRYDPLQPLPLKEDVTETEALFLLERREDYPGVDVREDWRRTYPYAPLASHVVGYLGAIRKDEVDSYRARGYLLSERVGQFGVEKSFELDLRGTPGSVTYEVDSRGAILGVVERVEPTAGRDLLLNIDLDLQQFAEETLETQVRNRRLATVRNPRDEQGELVFPDAPEVVPYKSPAGSIVVLDHSTGRVIAMASYPTFDNRWFASGVSGEKFRQIFPETKDPDLSILVNRAIQGRYNLGSTFKPFVAYAALNSGQLPGGVEYAVEDKGTYRLSSGSIDSSRCDKVRCEFRNATCRATGKPCVYGRVNVVDALAVSSDVFFYKIGDEIFSERGGQPILQEQVRLFGFGSRTGIDLPYEFAGTVPDAALKRQLAERGAISQEEGRGYYVGDNVQLAIGQGLLSATPLQLAVGYASIANGGFVMRPLVARALLAPGTPDRADAVGFADLGVAEIEVDFAGPDIVRQLDMSDGKREALDTGLSRVVTGPGVTSDYYHSTTGEALFRYYDYAKLPIAGKTGTAQGFQSRPWNDSSGFAAYSRDITQPYTVAAYLEKAGYGSQGAAPVVKCLFSAMAGDVRLNPVFMSDPLDTSSRYAALPRQMPLTNCLAGQFGLVNE
jgi:penicillin-binding protein 2